LSRKIKKLKNKYTMRCCCPFGIFPKYNSKKRDENVSPLYALIGVEEKVPKCWVRNEYGFIMRVFWGCPRRGPAGGKIDGGFRLILLNFKEKLYKILNSN
jgi:hypothetical protein